MRYFLLHIDRLMQVKTIETVCWDSVEGDRDRGQNYRLKGTLTTDSLIQVDPLIWCRLIQVNLTVLTSLRANTNRLSMQTSYLKFLTFLYVDQRNERAGVTVPSQSHTGHADSPIILNYSRYLKSQMV